MYVTVHFQVRKQKKGHLIEDGRKYIAYILNQHYMKYPEQPVVTLFDMTDAGISNMVGAQQSFCLFIVVGLSTDEAVFKKNTDVGHYMALSNNIEIICI
jgi:hypothetical protein